MEGVYQESRRRWRRIGLSLAGLLAFTGANLHGQLTATLAGTVSDQAGAVVPGASVIAVNQATNDKTATVTLGDGNFTFPVLLPGSYTIEVDAKDFQVTRQTDVTVNAGDHLRLPITLTVGTASQTVTVQATAQILETDNGQRGAVLDTKDIENLALESRNVTELLKVLPGVTSTPNGTSNGLGFSFSNIGVEGSPIGDGLNTNGTPYRGGTANLSDGVDINDPGCNCWSIATMNPDMVQEVSVQTSNFGADVSHGPVVVNNISKSGTSTYHGSAYFYGRNDAFNANDWVSNHNDTPRGHSYYYYPGGNIGGPVPFTHKSLLFWFGYESIRQNTGNAVQLTSYIPTADMLAGNFTATSANVAACPGGMGPNITGTYCNDLTGTKLPDGTVVGQGSRPAGMIPSQFLDPGAAVLAKIWPAANVNAATTPGNYNYFTVLPGLHNGWLWRGRVDYNLGDKTKIFVSYQQGYDSQVTGAHIYWTPSNAIPFPGGSLVSEETSKVLSGHFTHIFTNTLTNELVGSIGYANNPVSAPDVKAVYRSTLGYPTGAGYGTVYGTGDPWIPSYSSAGNQTFPDFEQQDIFSGGSGYPLLKEAPSAYDNVVKLLGAHILKVGFFYEMVNNDQGNFNTPNGALSFNKGFFGNALSGIQVGSPNNPTANFVMGNATGYNESSSNPKGDLAYKTISFYADDTWKATKRLTLQLGLRFDHMGRWYDRGNFGIPAFFPDRVQTDFGGGKVNPGLYWHAIDSSIPKSGLPTPLLVLSPRLGFAYDLYGKGETIFRGGWGTYRWGDQWGDYSGALGSAQGVANYYLPSNTSVLLSQIGSHAGPLVPAAAGTGTVYAVNPNDNSVPTTYSYNFTVSQRLPWNSLLEMAYVGNKTDNALVGGGNGATLPSGDIINQNKVPLGALFLPDPVTGITAPNPEDPSHDLQGNPLPNKTADYAPYGYAYGTNSIYVVNHNGYSNYNGAQVSWVKRSSHTTFDLNYTHSKTLGTDLAINPFSVGGNYGIENTDRPNVINTSYSYNVLKLYNGNAFLSALINDWMIAGITTWQGGGNLQAINNPNFAMSLTYTGIPAADTGVGNGYGVPTYYGTTAKVTIMPITTCSPGGGLAAHQHVTSNCFAPPPIGTFGPRTYPYLSGPSYTDADLAVAKTFHIVESQTLTLRASAFNFINHPLAAFSGNQLSLYYNTDYVGKASTLSVGSGSSGATSPTFGVTDTKAGAGTQRVLQLSLKYAF
jgi:hypothetical protein